MNRLAYLLLPALLMTETLGTARYEVRYKLGLFDTRVVTAEITWEESSWNGIPAYYSAAIIETTPFFRLFLASNYFAETYFSQDGLMPLYFENPFQHKGKDCKFEYLFRQDTGEIESTTTRGDNTEFLTFPHDGRTVDFLSLVHFIRFLDLSRMAEPLPMHILISGKSYPAELVYLGEDLEKQPDTPCDKFLLKLSGHGLMEDKSGNEIYLWRSCRADRMMIALETDLSSGTMYARLSSVKD